VRIIPIYEKNSLIFTGSKNGEFRSFVLDLDNQNVKSLQSKENDKIYKSSIIDHKEKKLFVYTEKIFIGESKYDHVLNIDDDYILKDL
jgi:outer membrane protein assembly factor BamB